MLDNFSTNIFPLINPNLTPEENLNFLANCNCCEKHQILKPKLFKKWIETPNNKGSNPYTSNTDPVTNNVYCKCECRHTARFICRIAE
tara:strand:+ start:61 stop:324 length:264 start_codon:yes stop_codon:yes gene_type:complete